MSAQNTPRIFDQCLFSITNVRAKAFSFCASHNTIRQTIDKFKCIDAKIALASAITLVTTQSHDSFLSSGILKEDRFSTMPYSELMDEMEDNLDLWSVEQQIFGDELATREVCRIGDLSLQLNLPATYRGAGESAVDAVQPELRSAFAEVYSSLHLSRSKVDRLVQDK